MPTGERLTRLGKILRRKSDAFSTKPADQLAARPHNAVMDDAVASQSFAQRAAVFGLLVYKSILSPLLPSCCKFYPSCSSYATHAVESHGVKRGLWLAAKRVLRCRPLAPGGYDPVPDA